MPDPDTTVEPKTSGDKNGEEAEIKRGAKGRFSGEGAKEAARRSAEKRREKADLAKSHDPSSTLTISVPIPQQSVVQGLISAASKGSAPAARELRAWLAEYPTQVGGQDQDAHLVVLQPEDMTPEQRERARAWLLRGIARRERRFHQLAELRQQHAAWLSGAAAADGQPGSLPPEEGASPRDSISVGPAQRQTDSPPQPI